MQWFCNVNSLILCDVVISLNTFLVSYIFCDIAYSLMPQGLIDDWSTLVKVMAWCHQATIHYQGFTLSFLAGCPKSHFLGWYRNFLVQSTPVISRLLGAKIRKRELSGSPVISRDSAKAPTREFRITDPYSQGHVLLQRSDAVARIPANDSAAFNESCTPIG